MAFYGSILEITLVSRTKLGSLSFVRKKTDINTRDNKFRKKQSDINTR